MRFFNFNCCFFLCICQVHFFVRKFILKPIPKLLIFIVKYYKSKHKNYGLAILQSNRVTFKMILKVTLIYIVYYTYLNDISFWDLKEIYLYQYDYCQWKLQSIWNDIFFALKSLFNVGRINHYFFPMVNRGRNVWWIQFRHCLLSPRSPQIV